MTPFRADTKKPMRLLGFISIGEVATSRSLKGSLWLVQKDPETDVALVIMSGIQKTVTSQRIVQDVKVPKDNRIGVDGFGFKLAMKILDGGRIGIAAQALGIAAGAYELALAYSHERKAFGKEIYKHQAIAFKLADMALEIEAARLLCLQAAWLKDQHKPYGQASAMTKLHASRTAMNVTKFSEASNILDSVSDDDDMVNSPAHYNFAGVECIDAIRAATDDGFEYYLQGNIMKYLWRFDYKDKPIEDLQKAKWYLDKLIEEVMADAS